MPRAIWSGAISFGLVNVPVKLFSAVSPKDVRFNQLEEGTGARIRQKRVSAETGEEVPYEKIVKGFEISPDRYVIITPEELEGLDPKAYSLLLQAMKESNKVAIARLVLRTKQYLAAIRPMGDVLCLETLLFADEVVPAESLEGLPGPDSEVSERELKMARQLIESLSTDFEPEKYRDEYRERVLALIEQKAEGQEIVAQPAAEEPAKVVDLMAALEASLAAAKS